MAPTPRSMPNMDGSKYYIISFSLRRAHTLTRSTRLFNSAHYSDLIIKFSGREIRAHRFIVCESNRYFEKLCGLDSPFAVSILSSKDCLELFVSNMRKRADRPTLGSQSS
jgi:hypothetical protein